MWYDSPTMLPLTDTLVGELSAADPEYADEFASNGDASKQDLETLVDHEGEIKMHHDGAGVASTEPVRCTRSTRLAYALRAGPWDCVPRAARGPSGEQVRFGSPAKSSLSTILDCDHS